MTHTSDPRESRTTLWVELPRLIDSARAHLDSHPALDVASIDISATAIAPGRLEVHVSGSRPVASARVLDWLDTLTNTSLFLQVEANPEQPKAMVFGRLPDGTPATVIAPLAEDDVVGITRDRIGDWVLHWLRMQAVDVAA